MNRIELNIKKLSSNLANPGAAMSKVEVVFEQLLGGPSPFRTAIADVQQITDQASSITTVISSLGII